MLTYYLLTCQLFFQLLESVNLVLLVGLSVDYVVHLAEAYSRSTRRDRKGRVQGMLAEVGISVLSGAVTTLGSSIFLLAAKILFFVQFGLFYVLYNRVFNTFCFRFVCYRYGYDWTTR